MGEKKEISMEAYQWGHFGTILFHLIIGSLIVYYNYTEKSKLGRKVTLWAAIVLIIVSLLALIPVFKDYDEIVIS